MDGLSDGAMVAHCLAEARGVLPRIRELTATITWATEQQVPPAALAEIEAKRDAYREFRRYMLADAIGFASR